MREMNGSFTGTDPLREVATTRIDQARAPDPALGTSVAALTPTTDTNQSGHCRTQVDAGRAPYHVMDGAGHLGHALQAGVTAA